MHEVQVTTSSSLSTMQALAEQIKRETPHLHVFETDELASPSLIVKDTLHGIIVGFSSEAEYATYCQIMRHEEGKCHG